MITAYIVQNCHAAFPTNESQWIDLSSEIERLNPDKIIVHSVTELAVGDIYGQLFLHLADYCISNNKIINVITPHSDQWLHPHVKCETSYANIIAAVPCFINSMRCSEKYDQGLAIVPYMRGPRYFKYHFSCYNVRITEHRIKMVEALAREQWINKGVVTFTQADKVLEYHNYAWKYYDGKIRMDEDLYSKDSTEHFRKPKSIEHCFLDIINETWFEDGRFHITEKTLRSIAWFKPFLVLGCKHFYKDYFCKKFELKLYDEIFDYSFDECELLEDRIEGIIDNLRKIINLSEADLQKLYFKLMPKMIYNKSKIIEIMYDKDRIVPQSLQFILENKPFKLYGMIDDYFFTFIKDMQWTPERIY